MDIKELDASWKVVLTAIDAAMKDRFPTGLNGHDFQNDLIKALGVVSKALKDAYEQPDVVPDAVTCKDG